MTQEIPKDLKEVADCHGHLCPGLVMGYIATKLALEKLGIESARDEELIAIVETKACGVDAVQYLASCTAGKGNLFLKDLGKQVYTFAKRPSGDGIRLVFNSQRIDKGLKEKGEMTRTDRINYMLSANPEDIFKFEMVNVPMPEEARIYPTLICEECGEGVMEARARIKKGKTVCIPCFEKT